MKNIIFECQVNLISGEQLRDWWKDTSPEKINFKYWETVRLLNWNMRKQTPEGYDRAKQLAFELFEKWPDKTFSNYWIASFHFTDVASGRSNAPMEDMKLAWEYAQKTLEMDPAYGPIRLITGSIFQQKQQHDLAIAELGKWVALEPNGSEAHHWLGRSYFFSGELNDAIREFEFAIRLNPYPPAYYYSWLAGPYLHKVIFFGGAGNLEKPIELCQKALEINTNDLISHMQLALIYSYQDNIADAQKHASAILQNNPKYSLKVIANTWSFKRELLKPTMELLRKVGIPEG